MTRGLQVVDTVEISLNLLCQVRQETRRRWVAGCPRLDVYSQGSTEVEAKKCLEEALLLWVKSCLDRGTLEEALRQSGLCKVDAIPTDAQHISVTPAPEPIEMPEGTFPVHLMIPAYQAAAFLSSRG